MRSCFGDLVFHRVRYFSRKLYQGDGTFAQISLAGSLPTGHLYGLNSSATETGELEQDLGLHHQLILEMLAGVRCPTGGAVLIPPYMTVGSVAKEPMFFAGMSLLDNLRYGCGDHVSEALVWDLCEIVGVQVDVYKQQGSQMHDVIGASTITELHLMSLVRRMLCRPDVLVVHNIGALEPTVAARLGLVLSNYARGYSLSRLGTRPRKMVASMGQGAEISLDAPPLVATTTSAPGGAGGPHPPQSLPESDTGQWDTEISEGSFSSRAAAEVQTTEWDQHASTRAVRLHSVRRPSACVGQGKSMGRLAASIVDHTLVEMSKLAVARRTVLWHAPGEVLDAGQIVVQLAYRQGRLQKLKDRPHKKALPPPHEPETPQRLLQPPSFASPPLLPSGALYNSPQHLDSAVQSPRGPARLATPANIDPPPTPDLPVAEPKGCISAAEQPGGLTQSSCDALPPMNDLNADSAGEVCCADAPTYPTPPRAAAVESQWLSESLHV